MLKRAACLAWNISFSHSIRFTACSLKIYTNLSGSTCWGLRYICVPLIRRSSILPGKTIRRIFAKNGSLDRERMREQVRRRILNWWQTPTLYNHSYLKIRWKGKKNRLFTLSVAVGGNGGQVLNSYFSGRQGKAFSTYMQWVCFVPFFSIDISTFSILLMVNICTSKE